MPARFGGLFGRTIWFVKYQCRGGSPTPEIETGRILPCSWHGLFPLETDLPDDILRDLFACPLHGQDGIRKSVEKVDYRDLKARKW